MPPLASRASRASPRERKTQLLSVAQVVLTAWWNHAVTRRAFLPSGSRPGSPTFTKAPAGYTHVEAATLTCTGVTAWRGLVVCGQVKPGDTVLILGTGSVSLFALQFAKAAGARVIGTSSSEEKLEKLRRLGADTVINYKAVPDWGQKAKNLTDGRGVDHVVEVGGSGTLTQSITACRTGGRMAPDGALTWFRGERVSSGPVS